ncbi:Kelch repeat type 2 [Lasiodiplodia theobromae]|uniref:Protein ral2 n=1 Tax=Lasiodiplodia theobromae TaxID=45133 RepID=A0A5N5CXH0_9PEZI|nr:Kelch repeat type 2 [Lasiodiplodia theobromae]KAB2569974.1 Protein ral2 [Lasiodiplodia theobromae]KAF4540819.1 Kelch repeat type 2 [Lasiodiplodia theobromae]KAF9634694.1 Kelch repeat type 2 [Lasiodiplodia theobromae]
MDPNASQPSPSQPFPDQQFRSNSTAFLTRSVNSSSTSLSKMAREDDAGPSSAARTPGMTPLMTAGLATPSQSTSGLSGLVCNVHRTTGREPHPLVGATTTVLGDMLYVFGGRRLSRTRPQLTNDLYQLDLVRRHWTKLQTQGDIPPPRYFHSVCALGDTKLVCYGGMSPAVLPNGQPTAPSASAQDNQPEVVVMSDIHIYDVNTRIWMKIDTSDSPQGRYAHCAAILPSSAVFASSSAPLSAIHHNPASASQPNSGSIGIDLDGTGGAEMVVVGGQDSANHYIEQISVFNLRSLKWTATNTLGRSCGAYRSVVAPLTTMPASAIGAGGRKGDAPAEDEQDPENNGSSMLIYSNYNFLDVKLELQIRMPDGTLTEKPMNGTFSPPGLRFPNGGVIANHFVVSGTFLTSSKQEYALWALDLRNLTWSRIDAGGSIFSQGSWNRGVLWSRRNTFVILGNRKRSLVEDYNHRRINFSNICMVELEAFGLYDNPRRTTPTSGYISVSSPGMLQSASDLASGGRSLSPAAEELGAMALGLRELADMEFLAIGGERIPVNSHLVARRWGPYFNQLLREGAFASDPSSSDAATLRPSTGSHAWRNSSITITPSIRTTSTALTMTPSMASTVTPFDPPNAENPNPTSRPRTLYLPHTQLTLQALAHYLYTSSLPPPNSTLCTPQILCSLLQLARPYRIDGLLEAVIERLHLRLDGRNTAAIFNAAAMAAGGGDAVTFFNGTTAGLPSAETLAKVQSERSEGGDLRPSASSNSLASSFASTQRTGSVAQGADSGVDDHLKQLRLNTDVSSSTSLADDEQSVRSASTETSQSDLGSVTGGPGEREVWAGEISAVVGLQKRGLRGLMEGRRIREMGRSGREGTSIGTGLPSATEDTLSSGRVGLGIAPERGLVG